MSPGKMKTKFLNNKFGNNGPSFTSVVDENASKIGKFFAVKVDRVQHFKFSQETSSKSYR
jgi:hypothetical protein